MCAVQMLFACSLDNFMKCWGRKVGKMRMGSLSRWFWRKEKRRATLPVEKPKHERGAGCRKKGDRVFRAC